MRDVWLAVLALDHTASRKNIEWLEYHIHLYWVLSNAYKPWSGFFTRPAVYDTRGAVSSIAGEERG